MSEVSQAELNQAHYEALEEDPIYALTYAVDILREEIMNNIPYQSQPVYIEVPPSPEPRWGRRQRYIIGQLKGEINFLENKINEFVDAQRKKGDYY